MLRTLVAVQHFMQQAMAAVIISIKECNCALSCCQPDCTHTPAHQHTHTHTCTVSCRNMRISFVIYLAQFLKLNLHAKRAREILLGKTFRNCVLIVRLNLCSPPPHLFLPCPTLSLCQLAGSPATRFLQLNSRVLRSSSCFAWSRLLVTAA